MNKPNVKHTPGPWEVVNMTVGSGENAYISPVIFAAGEEYGTKAGVCELLAKQHGRQVRRPVAEVQANARLIAAAPDCLSALQLVLNDNRLMNAMSKVQARAIMDAVTKATGGAE